MNFVFALLTAVRLTVPVCEHTEAETQMVADVMWLENGSTGKTEDENRQVLILTGAVVLNRVKSGEWGGRTVKDVIFAKGQYAASTRNRLGKSNAPKWVIELADEILTYGTNVPEYVVYQSMRPYLGTVWKIIDGEYFATNNKKHKNEGRDLVITTNRDLYKRQQFEEFKKKANRYRNVWHKDLRTLSKLARIRRFDPIADLR